MTRGVLNDFEPGYVEHVDEDEHEGEGEPQVTEDLVSDVPLAVPFHRQPVGVERL